MRLSISKSKNSTSLYVIKSITVNGKRTSKVVESLGTVVELEKKLDGLDPIEWAKDYVKELNQKEKENSRDIIVKYSPSKTINKDEQLSFNGGYLFLQQIYSQLDLPSTCKIISDKYKFTFNLDSILSRLVYGRILFPTSKLATHQLSTKFIEQPDFELQHVYRALEFLSKETDLIQSEIYKNSLKLVNRNNGVLYYDCTNYFFEIEQADGLKQYGMSKEHRPNPIVQMGLFMDGDGIPLAFTITKGNVNEQVTMTPLEEKIISDFELSKFIVCTDAGLASNANRKFNNKRNRSFITTQPIKKLKGYLKSWALDSEGWSLQGEKKTYDISKIDENEYADKIFYKERWMNEDDLEQRLIVSFSPKYKSYQRKIRQSQIDRAQKLIDSGSSKVKKKNQNDYKRLIETTVCTSDGEVAKKNIHTLNSELIQKEEAFDGFYAVCTNLEDDVSEIIKINQQRWEIEECFRIMKSEFKARPVYLSRDDRITAHFTTCFISLVIYRLLEKKIGEEYTCREILDGLREMNFFEIKGEGYIPTYTRTDFTDNLHEKFGFRTDYQIVSCKKIKKIFKMTKTR